MTKAVIHIGLHKTGTSSFQHACVQNRDLLTANRVLYPDDTRLTLGTVQHQGFPHILRTCDEKALSSKVAALAAMGEGYDIVLISTEELSTFIGAEENQARAEKFHKSVCSAFNSVRYICTIRQDQSLLKSALREAIEGTGVPYNGVGHVSSFVDRFYQRAMQIQETIGTHLTVLRYEDLAKGNLVSSLMEECTGLGLNIENQRSHTTQGKDARYILLGNVRMLMFNALSSQTPYTKEVNDAYRRVFQGITLSDDSAIYLAEVFNTWLDEVLESALSAQQRTLADIFKNQILPPND